MYHVSVDLASGSVWWIFFFFFFVCLLFCFESFWEHTLTCLSVFLCWQGKLFETTVADEATWTLGELWVSHTRIQIWSHCLLIPLTLSFWFFKRTSAWFGSSWWRRIERQETAGLPYWREITALMPGSRTRCRKNSLLRDFSGRSVVW